MALGLTREVRMVMIELTSEGIVDTEGHDFRVMLKKRKEFVEKLV